MYLIKLLLLLLHPGNTVNHMQNLIRGTHSWETFVPNRITAWVVVLLKHTFYINCVNSNHILNPKIYCRKCHWHAIKTLELFNINILDFKIFILYFKIFILYFKIFILYFKIFILHFKIFILDFKVFILHFKIFYPGFWWGYSLGVSPSLVSRYCEGYSFWRTWGPDLTFKISEGSDQNWSCPESALLAVSV